MIILYIYLFFILLVLHSKAKDKLEELNKTLDENRKGQVSEALKKIRKKLKPLNIFLLVFIVFGLSSLRENEIIFLSCIILFTFVIHAIYHVQVKNKLKLIDFQSAYIGQLLKVNIISFLCTTIVWILILLYI